MRTILLNVSERTFRKLVTGGKRIHGTVGLCEDGYDFHEHARNEVSSAAACDERVHRMKHGRVSLSKKRLRMTVSIDCDKERFALESFVDHSHEAARWMKDAWMNAYLDMPYGVWNK